MPASWHTADARASFEDIAKAREAAEALFKPRRSIVQPKTPVEIVSARSATEGAPASAEETPRRKSRILAAQPVPGRVEPSAPDIKAKLKPKRAAPQRRAVKISPSQHGRIRTLTKYGMTLEQLAELYDAPVEEIAKIAGAP